MTEPIELVVFDFDGVMTDNRVWTFADGSEAVACDVGDGFGCRLLLDAGVNVAVLSRSTHPAVHQRCRNIGLYLVAGSTDKGQDIELLAGGFGVPLARTLYVGNDVHDLPALERAAVAMAPNDAHAEVLEAVDYVLPRAGGHGAVRYACEWVLEHNQRTREHVTDGAAGG